MKMHVVVASILTLAAASSAEVRAQPAGAQGAREAQEQAAAAAEAMTLAERVYGSPDPAAAYARLGAADRKKLELATTPADVVITTSKIVGAQPAAAARKAFSGCWSLHQVMARQNVFHRTMYTFWQTTEVCVRNRKVYRVRVLDVGGETKTFGWRMDKNPTTSTKNVRWEGRGNARYYFVLGVYGADIQHPVDCIQLRLNADGRHYWGTESCDLAR